MTEIKWASGKGRDMFKKIGARKKAANWAAIKRRMDCSWRRALDIWKASQDKSTLAL